MAQAQAGAQAAVPLAAVVTRGAQADGTEALVVLHGLFGSAANWRTPLAKLLARRPQLEAHALDLRNHGASPHTPSMSYDLMAADVAAYLQAQRPSARRRRVLLGHSLGGRVAMQLALQRPQLVSELVVVDIAPRDLPAAGPAGEPAHAALVRAMQGMPLADVRTRRDAERYMEQHVPDATTRFFLLTNLVPASPSPSPGPGEQPAFRWRLNLPALAAFMPELRNMAFGPRAAPQPCPLPALFLAGGRSDYLTPADEPRIRALFPRASLRTLPDAGHWLHAERPDAFADALAAWLAAPSPSPATTTTASG